MSDKQEWFEEWFGEDYLELYRSRDFSAAAREVQTLVELLQQFPIHSVVDVACGAGRHAEELAQHYEKVIGVDLSDTLLRHARAHAAELPPGRRRVFNYVQSDMRSLPFGEASFDLVTSLFNSFGYFAGDEEHVKLLTEWNRVLKSSGVLVIDYFSRSYVVEHLVPHSTELRDGTTFEITRHLSQDGKRIVKTIRKIRSEGEREFRESVRLYAPHELFALLEKAHFSVVATYSGYSSERFDENTSKQLLVIAQKTS